MSVCARGADFSSHQQISEVELVAAKVDFGIVKATEGTAYVSPQLNGQVTALRRHGRVVGVYHFLTAEDGVRQWDHFEQVIRPLGIYLVAVDHERAAGSVPPDHVAEAFIRRGGQRGYKVGRYGSADGTMRRNLGETWRWVARWDPSAPTVRWDVWQFSDGGGRQDFDVFRGDLAALEKFVASLKPRPKPKPRWWLRDLQAGRSMGPYWLVQMGAVLIAYAARHRQARSFSLERK